MGVQDRDADGIVAENHLVNSPTAFRMSCRQAAMAVMSKDDVFLPFTQSKKPGQRGFMMTDGEKRSAVAVTVIAFALLAFAAESQAQPASDWLPYAQGPHATGTVSEMWIDEGRPELATRDPSDKRRLMIQIWYPADPTGNAQLATYAPNLNLYRELLRDWGDAISARLTRSALNAPLQSSIGPFPILIYNHGGGFPHFSGTMQTEFLASHGYVVVAIGHSENSGIRTFPDGSIYDPDARSGIPEPAERTGTELDFYYWLVDYWRDEWRWRTQDVSYVLDQLHEMNLKENSRFYGKLDLERVGVFGWSQGGATAIHATVDEPRIRAAANLDGWLYGHRVENTGAGAPVLFLNRQVVYSEMEGGTVDPEFQELRATVQASEWKMLRLTEHDWYRARIERIDHGHFSDYYLSEAESPAEGLMLPSRATEIINAVLLEFFDHYVQGRGRMTILSGEGPYPELRVTTRQLEGEASRP